MIGNKYNKWTVISLAEPAERNKTRVLAKCDCGTEKIHLFSHVKTGKTKQCNNCRRNPLTIGSRYGKYVIIQSAIYDKGNKSYRARYLCKCDCGFEKLVSQGDLKSGKATQCLNCYNKNRINLPNKTHGLSHTKTHRIWCAMKERCLSSKNKDYKDYGGRGITVCERWLKFENFFEDMGMKPDGLQIDRIDNDKGYYKENCRWVTAKENCNNRRKKNASRNSDTSE